MWLYQQTGMLIGPDGLRHAAYSGRGDCKNKPSAQMIEDWGPIPCGVYRIGDPIDTVEHGPFVLSLTPDAANEMFGRGGFLIHGDSITTPGTASKGCVIVDHATRVAVHLSQDRELHVVPGPAIEAPIAVDPGMETE